MSINKLDAENGRLTLQGDYVVHHEKKITFELQGDRIPSILKGSYTGDVFITNRRVVFVNNSSKGYKTFSMDFQSIRNTEVKQPIFGSIHIKGFVRSEINGGWEGSANFKIDFPKGGAIKFAEVFQSTVKSSMRNQNTETYPVPPTQPAYYPPPPMGAYGAYPPPQPGFYQYQSGPPPAGYNMNQAPMAPPPMQPPPAYQQQQSGSIEGSASQAKAQEAYAYGSTAYIPSDAPPPYNPEYKKDH